MALGKRNKFPSYSRSEGRRPGVGLLVLIVVVAAVGWFGYQKYVSMNTDKADTFLASGHYEDAESYYQKAAKLPFSGGKGHLGLGALDLLRGDQAAATAHFKTVLDQRSSADTGAIAVMLDRFIDGGRYDSGKQFTEFLQSWLSESALEDHAVKFAALCLGNRDLAGARAHLDKADSAMQKSQRYLQLKEKIDAYDKEGRVPIFLDRKGREVLAFNVKTNDYEFASPRIFAGWQSDDGLAGMLEKMDPVDRQNLVHTTLDLDLQRAAQKAMGDYKGTMILTDPATGDILAAFGTGGYNPFNYAFEPGSVIKVLTYALFLEDGGDPARYAPRKYPSAIKIGDNTLWDWTEQGRLESVEQGMAASCNLMFAQMGMELTWPGISKGFSRFFDGKRMPGYWGEGYFGGILREPADDYELARTAIGLEFLETSALGIVLIPSSVANDGTAMTPRLFTHFANVEGKTYKEMRSETLGRLFSDRVAGKVKDSMVASLVDQRGTARRSKVDFVEAAMKTGTSGDRPFNSVMIGMFPVAQPKVAFSLFLHNGGKCEYNGAVVARRLQESVRELAPEYLGR